jgi:hypothetical protein
MERLLFLLTETGKHPRVSHLQAALEGSGLGPPQTPENKIQIAMAAVYLCAYWRQGFDRFSLAGTHQELLSN